MRITPANLPRKRRRRQQGPDPGRKPLDSNALIHSPLTAGALTADALRNVPECIILGCAATCSICGQVASPGHCITIAHGFRCSSCCEATTHKTPRMA